MIQLKMIQKENITDTLAAAYRVMTEIGMDIHNETALTLLKDAGCQVEGVRVRIPKEIVDDAIAAAPSVIEIYDRNGEAAMSLGGRNCYFGPGPTCPNFFDPRTGERRPAVKQDAADTAKVVDALPHIDYAMSLCVINDRIKTLADVDEIHAMVQNTTKPLVSWSFNKENLQDMIDLCAAAKGSLKELQQKPFLIVYSEPTTPLVHTKEALDKLMLLAKNRIPCIYTPGMIMGGTAPATIPGALAIGIADTLTGLVIGQLIEKGAPMICGAAGGPMDMKTMQHSYGAPEWMLLHGASAEIFHSLQLPVFHAAGVTDAKVIDAQAAIEGTMQILCALGSGGNLIHDVGFADLGMTGSLAQLTICDEIIAMAKRLYQGITFDEEAFAFDVIKKVGPGGNFLMEEHTANHFRETWNPDLIDRYGYATWEAKGSKNMTERANEKVRAILDSHQPAPLTEEIKNAIDVILARAEARAK
ncbi:MAG TPA: trimethylamine methyltransferase family protein [Clostridiales bacterium]|nr:trimethylamine methyltransferase family protein [Clostridiales bacterium]